MTASASADEIRFDVQGGVGLITLERPKALNALTEAMCTAIDGRLARWARDPAVRVVLVQGTGDRAFCAGGDVRAVYDDGMAVRRGQSDGRTLREFFRAEYQMNRRIKVFPKPYIALIDGITMGGGVGLAIHGSHRVATERTLMAMPETGIGLFPDVGTCYVLPRLPGETGLFLALTGTRIKAPDIGWLGLATHTMPSDRRPPLIEDLLNANWTGNPRATVDIILARHAADVPGPAILPDQRDLIDRCFSYDRVETILAALDADGSAFAAETAATIRTMSPTSLKLCVAEMRRGRMLDFDSCMVLDYRLTQSILAEHDFYEGIRAVLVDKDRNPKWNPSSLESVDDVALDRYFAVPPHGDLTFTD